MNDKCIQDSDTQVLEYIRSLSFQTLVILGSRGLPEKSVIDKYENKDVLYEVLDIL